MNEFYLNINGFRIRRIDPYSPDDYKNWSDGEFIEACNCLNGLDLPKKIEVVYDISRWLGLFKSINRSIKNKNYSYGIDILDTLTANKVGKFFIDKEKAFWLNGVEKQIAIQLKKCEDLQERISLINEEIGQIDVEISKSLINENYSGYNLGYNREKLKKDIHFPLEVLPIRFKNIEETGFNWSYCMFAIIGASDYLTQRLFLKLKKELENSKNKSIDHSFKLVKNVLVKDCYDSLIENGFINDTTSLKDFNLIFLNTKVVKNKINWERDIKTLSFFVSTIYKEDKKLSIKPVCVPVRSFYKIAEKCFIIKGNNVQANILKNNKRQISKKETEQLKKAIGYLRSK